MKAADESSQRHRADRRDSQADIWIAFHGIIACADTLRELRRSAFHIHSHLAFYNNCCIQNAPHNTTKDQCIIQHVSRICFFVNKIIAIATGYMQVHSNQ